MGVQGPLLYIAVVKPGPVLDMVELARAQEGFQEMQQLRAKLDAQHMLVSGHRIWCDISYWVLRPLVPATTLHLVYISEHSLAHPGICATRLMLTSRFVWTSCSTLQMSTPGVGNASSVH